jgi:transmembrane sensor
VAADWFAANRAGPLCGTDRKAFFDWLRASPGHVEEYLAIAHLARELHAATDNPGCSLDALILEARREDSGNVVYLDAAAADVDLPPTRRASAWGGMVAVAATLLVVATLALLRLLPEPGSAAGSELAYRTTHGEQREWTLADGSVIHLDTDTAIRVLLSPTDRRLLLDGGRVLFEVAHDGRPFDVVAGSATIHATGTQFDVYLAPDVTVVTVIEGSVAIMKSAASPGGTIPLHAGQQLRLDARNATAVPTELNAQRAVAWVHQQIAFDRQPAGDVADEFNRYAAIPVRIDDPALRATRISGVFSAHDTASFVAFLQTLDGVTVENTGREIRVARRGAR